MAGKQGFASMDEGMQKKIAAAGGKASHGSSASAKSTKTGSSARGAAGHTSAAKRGGQNSRSN